MAMSTVGKAVTMKKKQGPRLEERVSGTRERGKVGKGRSIMLKDVGFPVALKIASSSVFSR